MSVLDLLGLNRIFKGGTEVKPTRKILNFIGEGVSIVDNPGQKRTDITIGGGGEGTITGPGTATPGHVTVWGADETEIADGGVALADLVTQDELDDAIAAIPPPTGTGDTFSGAVSADNEIARYDGTNNKTIQRSTPKIADDGRITTVTDPSGAQDADTKAARDAAITTALGWKTYCDFNFTQMANRTITDGDLLIDGITMTAGNTQTGNTSANIVNGTGLVFAATSTTNTFWYHTAHSAAWLGYELSRISGWTFETSEARIFAEFYLTVGTANYATASFGFTKRLNFLGNDWSPMLRQAYAAGQQRGVHYVYGATEDYIVFDNTFNVGMAHYRGQYNLAFYAKLFSGANADPNSSAFGNVASMSLVGRHTEARGVGAGPRVKSTDAMMAFVCGQNGNTSNNTVCTFKRLRIEYKL